MKWRKNLWKQRGSLHQIGFLGMNVLVCHTVFNGFAHATMKTMKCVLMVFVATIAFEIKYSEWEVSLKLIVASVKIVSVKTLTVNALKMVKNVIQLSVPVLTVKID